MPCIGFLAIILLTIFWLKAKCAFVCFDHWNIKIPLHLPRRKCDLFVKQEKQHCHRNDWNLQEGTCWWRVKQLRCQLGILSFWLKEESGGSRECQTTVSSELLWKTRRHILTYLSWLPWLERICHEGKSSKLWKFLCALILLVFYLNMIFCSREVLS